MTFLLLILGRDRSILMKLQNIKDKKYIIKATLEKRQVNKGMIVQLAGDFSTDDGVKGQWENILKLLRENKY